MQNLLQPSKDLSRPGVSFQPSPK